jgi:hypothetical protein
MRKEIENFIIFHCKKYHNIGINYLVFARERGKCSTLKHIEKIGDYWKYTDLPKFLKQLTNQELIIVLDQLEQERYS